MIRLERMNSFACRPCIVVGSHKSYFLGTIHNVNHIVSYFELFIRVSVITTGDRFSSLPKSFAEMTSWFLNRTNWLKSASPTASPNFGPCESLCCDLFWTVWVLQTSCWNQIWTKRTNKFVLAVSKILIVGTIQFVQGSISVANHEVQSLK